MDFLTPGVWRLEAEVHHTRLTDIFSQCLLSWLWVIINYKKYPKHILTFLLLPWHQFFPFLMKKLFWWHFFYHGWLIKDLKMTGLLLSLPGCATKILTYVAPKCMTFQTVMFLSHFHLLPWHFPFSVCRWAPGVLLPLCCHTAPTHQPSPPHQSFPTKTQQDPACSHRVNWRQRQCWS